MSLRIEHWRFESGLIIFVLLKISIGCETNLTILLLDLSSRLLNYIYGQNSLDLLRNASDFQSILGFIDILTYKNFEQSFPTYYNIIGH